MGATIRKPGYLEPGGPFPIGARHAEKESRCFSASPVPLLFLALATSLILASARARTPQRPSPAGSSTRSGRPVPGARVFVSSGAAATTSAETDSDGRFTLQPIGDGRATVRVALDGFRAEAVTVESTAAPRDLGTHDAQGQRDLRSDCRLRQPGRGASERGRVERDGDRGRRYRGAAAPLGRRRAAQRSRPDAW